MSTSNTSWATFTCRTVSTTRHAPTFTGVLQTDPKNIKALWSLGVVDNLTGNPQAALDSLTRGSSLAIQVDNQEQQALILLSMGISYRLLNKPDEALLNYQQSIAINEKIGQKRGVAAALTRDGHGTANEWQAGCCDYQL